MEQFRGKEAARFVHIYIGITVVCRITTIFISLQATVMMLLFSVIVFIYFRRYIKTRNNEVRALSQQLNDILHGGMLVAINNYEEGELSILKSEIQKMIVRLHEQAEALQNEKIYLKDSIADISHQLRTPLTSIQMIVPRLEQSIIHRA